MKKKFPFGFYFQKMGGYFCKTTNQEVGSLPIARYYELLSVNPSYFASSFNWSSNVIYTIFQKNQAVFTVFLEGNLQFLQMNSDHVIKPISSSHAFPIFAYGFLQEVQMGRSVYFGFVLKGHIF